MEMRVLSCELTLVLIITVKLPRGQPAQANCCPQVSWLKIKTNRKQILTKKKIG
jgi:hypothetical protein